VQPQQFLASHTTQTNWTFTTLRAIGKLASDANPMPAELSPEYISHPAIGISKFQAVPQQLHFTTVIASLLHLHTSFHNDKAHHRLDKGS
jgi:hypothetical protein